MPIPTYRTMRNDSNIDTKTMRSLLEAANMIDEAAAATKPAFGKDLRDIGAVFTKMGIRVVGVHRGGNYISVEFENDYGYKHSTVAFTSTDGGWTVDHRYNSPPSGHREFLGWLDQAARYGKAVEAVLAKRLKGTKINDWE